MMKQSTKLCLGAWNLRKQYIYRHDKGARMYIG